MACIFLVCLSFSTSHSAYFIAHVEISFGFISCIMLLFWMHSFSVAVQSICDLDERGMGEGCRKGEEVCCFSVVFCHKW